MSNESVKDQNRIALSWFDPNDLRPNPWNPNTMSGVDLDRLDANRKRLGVFKPIVARRLADGTVEVLGGWHRVLLDRRDGLETPTICHDNIDDDKAKEISLTDNYRYGTDDPYLFAELIGSLAADIDDLGTFLPIHLDDLDLEVPSPSDEIDSFEKERAPFRGNYQDEPQTHRLMKFLVPISDAHLVEDRINSVVGKLGLGKEAQLEAVGLALVHICKRVEK